MQISRLKGVSSKPATGLTRNSHNCATLAWWSFYAMRQALPDRATKCDLASIPPSKIRSIKVQM